jgi:hypothetical protein
MADIYTNSQGYTVDREKTRQQARKKKRENKLRAIEYLGGACNDCKSTLDDIPVECFEIDHVLSEKKKYNFSTIMRYWKKIKKEIDTCKGELVCKNCHAIRTAKMHRDPEYNKKLQKTRMKSYRNKWNREEPKQTKKHGASIAPDGWMYEVKMVRVEEEKKEEPDNQTTLKEGWT